MTTLTKTDLAAPSAPAAWKYDPTKELDAHPLAEIFPLMQEAEFDAFVEDIKVNGLQRPITIFEGKILEGRNRYRAVLKAGHQYKLKDENFETYTDIKPLEFVISANVHRRHLDTSQRAMTAVRLVTTKLGDNQHKGGITIAAAAKMLNVSDALVKTAKEVFDKGAPEVIDAVQKGKKRLGAVKKLLDKPKEEQAKLLKPPTKTTTSNSPKSPKADPEMVALDEFKKKWQGFDEMQKRAFVTFAKDDLDKLLQQVRRQEAMIGAAA